jgi:hypothetical protein
MGFVPFVLGQRDFYSEQQIKESIRDSKNFDPTKENPSDADALLIFETSKQQTWIVSTSERLYCILDDIREEKPHINWSMQRDRVLSQDQLLLEIETKEHTNTTGLVDIGTDHKNWLYSKKLFASKSVDENIRELIKKQMLE